MNITQVYLTPNYDDTDVKFRYRYQVQTNYIQLFIEECLRKNKLDIGAFNRLVFSEGGNESEDFNVVGNNALPVAIKKNYDELSSLKSDRETHNYYISKFLEGFKKFDAHFLTSLEAYLSPLLVEKYKNELFYEKKMATKRLKEHRLQAIGRYSKDAFELIINAFEKNKLVNSYVAFKCEPDMFIVKYDVYRVEISDTVISVVNKIREKTLELKVSDII